MPPSLLELIAARFRALGEPMRLRILQMLLAGERNVKDLAAGLETTQSNTSRHLKALLDTGLVARRREGLEAIYRIADPVVEQLCRLMCEREEERAREHWSSIAPNGRTRRNSR
jgi:ArsR family transcriptional regulator